MRTVAARALRGAGCLLAGLLLTAGCTADPAPVPSGTPTPVRPAGQDQARQVVHDYLDAMRAKDVALGRAQLCPATQLIFDSSATSANGDFAPHFTVPEAEITDTRQVPVGHEVTATVTVATGTVVTPVELLFTVTPVDDGESWCIHDETLAPTSAATTESTAPPPAGEPAG
ncbi:hypothetical protein O7632_13980 [Solwaraspora sp. WMMD406]|uniref:hypothetical protein n=1 Tax=Solwaraspora sp. WMMD406 TaxID=3016095 RepID=UPI0024169C8A|nr:hypothetical protein [Solwaraspora sp. WMMD406]MDG4765195.1 hypothetical protein [Solwaraspora sp. WMMD406]